MNGEALVRDYLGRLDAASWPLPPGRRDELRAEVAEHIETALAEAGSRDEVAVRNVLERLGRPEEIAAADADPAVGATPAMSTPQAAGSSWGAVEILAILFLTLGAIVLPLIGPLVGLVFAWASRQWTTREKAIATLIVLVLLAIPLIGLGLFATSSGTAAPQGGIS